MEIATVPFYTIFALLMKRFLFFLLAFCLLLCSKNIYALGDSHLNTAQKVHELKKAANFDSAILLLHNTSPLISGIQEPQPTILTLEDQNEDEDIIKKHLAVARTFTAFAYAFLISYSGSSISENLITPRDITAPASCKYIFQRVLRI